MERCPVCRARYTGKEFCHRCKAPIGKLAHIRDQANSHLEKAMESFMEGDDNSMFFYARRAFALYSSKSSLKIHACAALLTKKFDLAYSLRKKYYSSLSES